jgi:hypothetical protein
VLQVSSPESWGRISACSSSSLSIEGVRSELVQTLWSGFSLALAIIILLALVPGIAFSKLVIRLLTPERDKKDESKRNYWRIHGG